jgi:hypothetical protein
MATLLPEKSGGKCLEWLKKLAETMSGSALPAGPPVRQTARRCASENAG